VLAVALLFALSSGPTMAQGRVDATSEEVAIASMLAAGDLQGFASTNGVTVGDATDLPGYTENGGLREVRQTWSADDGRRVFDFRWQFPDEDAAASFLDAAEDVLSETSSGAEKRPLPSAERPLPDTRLYTFEDTLFGTGTVGFNYLMGQRNVVAKVYVSGNKEEVTASAAAAIADAAADASSPQWMARARAHHRARVAARDRPRARRRSRPHREPPRTLPRWSSVQAIRTPPISPTTAKSGSSAGVSGISSTPVSWISLTCSRIGASEGSVQRLLPHSRNSWPNRDGEANSEGFWGTRPTTNTLMPR